MLMLVLLGAFTKSPSFLSISGCQAPWAAPTARVRLSPFGPTLVKAGVFPAGAAVPPHLSALRNGPMLVGWGGPDNLADRRVHRPVQHDLKGLLAYSTISHLGLDHLAVRHWHPPRRRRRSVPYYQPRHIQSFAVHGRWHYRSRNRQPRYAPHQRSVEIHARTLATGDGGVRRHGRRSLTQWLPL